MVFLNKSDTKGTTNNLSQCKGDYNEVCHDSIRNSLMPVKFGKKKNILLSIIDLDGAKNKRKDDYSIV